jgi:hypothetical protein
VWKIKLLRLTETLNVFPHNEFKEHEGNKLYIFLKYLEENNVHNVYNSTNKYMGAGIHSNYMGGMFLYSKNMLAMWSQRKDKCGYPWV